MNRSKVVMMATALAVLSSCSSGSIDDTVNSIINNGGTSGGSSSASTESASIGDLTSFDIAVDSTALSETETIPSDNEDYIENNSFTDVISIVFNGSSASYSGTVSGVSVSISGADVVVTSTVKNVCYQVSGSTTDGFLKIYSDYKYELDLNGVSITNPDGAAINLQSKKRAYIVLGDETVNTLTDGTGYSDATDDEDMKGTLFGEGKMLFSGTGSLRVYANTKAGISCDDYIQFRPGNNIYVKATSGNGIKANDAIIVKGGVINVETSDAASKGLSCDGYIEIDGGRTTAITTGNGEYDSDDRDVSGCAGVKADSTFTMNGGELYCKSTGTGGKGINCDQQIIINDGTIKVITTGTQYVYGSLDTSAKGIKSDGNMYINGGSVAVRTTGGEGSEGLESKGTMTISSGTVETYTYDDGLNSAGAMTLSGGYIYCYSTTNDGIDSNSTLTISGGTIIACGTTTPEGGIDCDNNTLTISGGTLISIGGATSSPTQSSARQPVAIVSGSSLSTNTYLTLSTSSGENIWAFKLPRSYTSYVLMITSPEMTTGSSYMLASGATVSGGTDFNGYLIGATVSGGSTIASLTLNSTLTTSGNTGGNTGGGGNHGGGRW